MRAVTLPRLSAAIVLTALFSRCLSAEIDLLWQPGALEAWKRGEYESPTYVLTALRPRDVQTAYQFPTDTVPPRERQGMWCTGEPPIAGRILSSDLWTTVFSSRDFHILASEEYKLRECRALAETFGKTKPRNVCPDGGLFYSYYDLCVRDRDFLVMVDKNLKVVGWSRLGSRFAFAGGKAKNPYPVPDEMWGTDVRLLSVPNPRFNAGESHRHASEETSGLVPPPAELKGKIEGGNYISPARDFQIAIPHKEGFPYLTITEQSGDPSTSVTFASAFDRKIFRVEVTKLLATSKYAVEDVADKAFKYYIGQAEKAYDTPCKREATGSFASRNGKGVFAFCMQAIQKRFRFPQPDVAGERRAHLLYMLDYGTHAALFWIEVADPTGAAALPMYSGEYAPAQAFVSSFSVRQ